MSGSAGVQWSWREQKKDIFVLWWSQSLCYGTPVLYGHLPFDLKDKVQLLFVSERHFPLETAIWILHFKSGHLLYSKDPYSKIPKVVLKVSVGLHNQTTLGQVSFPNHLHFQKLSEFQRGNKERRKVGRGKSNDVREMERQGKKGREQKAEGREENE